MAERRPSGRWFLGLLLIVLGGLFLLDSLDALEVGDFFSTFWPIFLILAGAWITLASRGRQLPGWVLLFLGVGFQAARLELIDDDWIGDYGWPLLLVLIGLWLILSRPFARNRSRSGAHDPHPAVAEDWFDVFAFLGGRKQTVSSQAWRGGEATALMGGVDLDLRDARPVAEGATLQITAVMGGVEVRVPRSWVVTVRGTPLLGSVEDHTRVSSETDEAGSPDPSLPRLDVHATAIMGGVEIKH